MGIVKQLLPLCDICGESNPDEQLTNGTRRALWRNMRASGWKRRGNLDVCPDCVQEALRGEEEK